MSTTQMVWDLDQVCVNTMRTLAIDRNQPANSGPPGTPMGMSPTVYCLWQRLLRFDPEDPIWMNRDRFVLSAGHASTLLYTILHLARVKAVDPEYEILGRPSVTLDDLKSFRQFGSRCAGHPEYRWTSGVETTTGPLGQGVATSVGMAIAEKWLAARYNKPDFELFGYRIYALCGDGCMMEGISSEAASVAGHLKLDNLCWIYDNNHITIEGKTDIAFTEDVAGRFLAYGWNVVRVGDDKDLDRIENALRNAAGTTGRPSIVIVDSHIGYGSPHRQDTSAAHGEPLGEEEIKLVKQAYGWPPDAKFLVPSGVYEHLESGIGRRGREAREQWEKQFAEYRKQFPELAAELDQIQKRELPVNWLMDIPVIHVFTHDAIGVGEDGPTHQPIEHLISLRAIPNLVVLRPCDANEVAEAWRTILAMPRQPVALILTRQNLPTFDRKRFAAASGLSKGAYVLADAEDGNPEVLLMATGSEVSLCVEAYEELTRQGVRARVVSMPSWELFERQSEEYRRTVLPTTVKARVAVEQASTLGWCRYVGIDGAILGMKTFGASAPLKVLQKEFGFTTDHVVEAAKAQLAQVK